MNKATENLEGQNSISSSQARDSYLLWFHLRLWYQEIGSGKFLKAKNQVEVSKKWLVDHQEFTVTVFHGQIHALSTENWSIWLTVFFFQGKPEVIFVNFNLRVVWWVTLPSANI